jgi:hypothetical protein
MTSTATPNVISSQVEASGPSQLDLLDGLMTDHYGPDRALASHSRRQAKDLEPMIQGICGRTFVASSVPDGPLSLWESRLRERLATVGSTESALIWKSRVTPAGRSISRLAVSTRHTNETGSTGSQWSTPRASDGAKGGPNQRFSAGGQPLPTQIHRAHWITASARDWKDTPGMATESGSRNRVDQLPRQMAQEPQAMWPTTKAAAAGPDFAKIDRSKTGLSLQTVMAATEPTGPVPTGSTATTAKRGAPNPVFAFWLMGFPVGWISGALLAMQSYRKPRKKS